MSCFSSFIYHQYCKSFFTRKGTDGEFVWVLAIIIPTEYFELSFTFKASGSHNKKHYEYFETIDQVTLGFLTNIYVHNFFKLYFIFCRYRFFIKYLLYETSTVVRCIKSRLR